MRPLRLEIQGLTSFRTAQAIDFSGLDLFVITGPTGAGKSSVLDAVALALYGEVPRTGKKNAADLVTHGDTRARILLEFQADGNIYRVARQLPRNGAQKATLERQVGGDWITEVEDSGVRPVNARLEEIIGLNFEGFTRAVLLPQGDFAVFLRGDPKQRREILVRLLDLGRYERAGQIARQRAEELSKDVSTKEQWIEHEYGDASEESVAAAAAEAAAAEERAIVLETARVRVQLAASAVAEVERLLGDIDRETGVVAATARALVELERNWTKLAPEVKKQEQALRRAVAALKEAELTSRSASAAFEATRTRTGDESVLAELDQACGVMMEATVATGELNAKMQSTEVEIAELDVRLPEAVDALKAAEARSDAAEKAQHALAAEAARIADNLRKARDRVAAERTIAAAVAQEARARAERATSEQALHAAEIEAVKTGERLDHLRRGHAAILMRGALTVGEPCPVCQHLVSEIPESPRDIDAAIKAAGADADAARKLARAAQSRLNEAITEAKVAAQRLVDARKSLRQFDDAPPLDAAEAEAGLTETRRVKLQSEREAAADALKEARRRHTAVTTDLVRARERRDSLTRECKGADKRLRLAEKVLVGAFPSGIPEDGAKVIAERRRDLKAAREAEEKARIGRDQSREAHSQAIKSGERLQRLERQLMQGCAEQRGILGHLATARDGKIGAGLKASQATVVDELRVLGEWTGVVQTELSGRREAKEKERQESAADLTRAAAAMDISLPSAAPATIDRAAQKAVTDTLLAAQRAGNRLTDLKAKLARRRELEKGIAAARELAHLNRALADELRQNRFLDYVLAESMRQLATLASDELRSISAGRYSLTAEETSFLVIDHANADETRSVDTLSGGETFLASLSLAIALGRSITDIAGQAIGSRLEAMFIDEGFGTLDAETLDVVIDALERLRDTERMVGVITHVSQLAERIPEGFAVERDGSTSQVRRR